MNGYKNHWISPITIVEYMFFWTNWSKCGRNKWIINDKDWVDSPEWADKLAKRLTWVSNTIKWVWDKLDHQIRYVKIDQYDTWSMDHTLAYIILPMLKQLRDTKQGSPMTDDEDVPEYLRTVKKPKLKRKKNDVRDTIQVHAVDMDDDSLIHKKWTWILNEMIWAFEQKIKDDDESEFFDHSAYLDSTNTKDWLDDLSNGQSKLKVDWDGLKAHQARKANGFRLLGKYYEGLWD